MYHNMYDVRADILIERQQWANSGSTYGTYVHTASTGSTYVHTGRREYVCTICMYGRVECGNC